MKSTLIIENESADSYFPGYEITGFFKYEDVDTSHVNLVFTQGESDNEKHIILECEDCLIDAVYNRVCYLLSFRYGAIGECTIMTSPTAHSQLVMSSFVVMK